MNKKGLGVILGILAFILVGFIVLLFLDAGIHANVFYTGDNSDYLVQIPLNVSKLSILDLDSVNNAEEYKKFADNTNNLIKILNDQLDSVNIPELGDDYSKVSKFITEYSPLINNYNEVINNAIGFESNKCDETLQEFYTSTSRFGFESITIIGGIFYSASYQTVGSIYRASGLQFLAFKCPKCVGVALSNLHWGTRTALVEASSMTAKEITDSDPDKLDNISMEKIRQDAEKIINQENMNELKEKSTEVMNDILNKSAIAGKNLKEKADNFFSGLSK